MLRAALLGSLLIGVVAAATVVVASASLRPQLLCRPPADPGGYFAHPSDARKFVQCSNGVAHIHRCPEPLHWNQRLLTCDWVSVVGDNPVDDGVDVDGDETQQWDTTTTGPTTVSKAESSTGSTTESTAGSTAVSTAVSTTESSEESTPESTVESTVESTMTSTPESTPESTSESPTESTAVSTTESTAKSTPEPTPESTAESTTDSTTESPTESTTVPTAESSEESTPESTPETTAESTAESTAASTVASTAEPEESGGATKAPATLETTLEPLTRPTIGSTLQSSTLQVTEYSPPNQQSVKTSTVQDVTTGVTESLRSSFTIISTTKVTDGYLPSTRHTLTSGLTSEEPRYRVSKTLDQVSRGPFNRMTTSTIQATESTKDTTSSLEPEHLSSTENHLTSVLDENSKVDELDSGLTSEEPQDLVSQSLDQVSRDPINRIATTTIQAETTSASESTDNTASSESTKDTTGYESSNDTASSESTKDTATSLEPENLTSTENTFTSIIDVNSNGYEFDSGLTSGEPQVVVSQTLDQMSREPINHVTTTEVPTIRDESEPTTDSMNTPTVRDETISPVRSTKDSGRHLAPESTESHSTTVLEGSVKKDKPHYLGSKYANQVSRQPITIVTSEYNKTPTVPVDDTSTTEAIKETNSIMESTWGSTYDNQVSSEPITMTTDSISTLTVRGEAISTSEVANDGESSVESEGQPSTQNYPTSELDESENVKQFDRGSTGEQPENRYDNPIPTVAAEITSTTESTKDESGSDETLKEDKGENGLTSEQPQDLVSQIVNSESWELITHITTIETTTVPVKLTSTMESTKQSESYFQLEDLSTTQSPEYITQMSTESSESGTTEHTTTTVPEQSTPPTTEPEQSTTATTEPEQSTPLTTEPEQSTTTTADLKQSTTTGQEQSTPTTTGLEQSTPTTTEPDQSTTTTEAFFEEPQDPRLPYRAIQCRGLTNRIKFASDNCEKFYQCFEGYAYLLNCHTGYAFDVPLGRCVPIREAECFKEPSSN